MSNTVFNVEHFVNRDTEIEFICEQCLPSLTGNRPINPQFIEFNGIWGIGKTTMLKRIRHQCSERKLPPIWIEASDNPDQLFRNIVEQLHDSYEISVDPEGDALDRSLAAVRALLRKYDAAVIFIDALDAAKEEHLKRIKEMLHRFMENGKLLFIMASRKIIDFDNAAPFKWRLRFFSLKPFSREYCLSYINKLTQGLQAEQVDQIFLLTRGYPIAVDVAVEVVRQEALDLTVEEHRKRLVQVIYEQVIERGILTDVRQDTDQLLWYQTMLRVFSIPRRFNLALMQKMTEKFAAQYKLGSSLAYMSLQKRINANTGLLDWREDKTGYAMESPVRHLFLMKMKVEDPEKHAQIHEFLMEENWRLALQISGTDKLHSLQEYLYHSASCLDDQKLQDNVDKAIQQILVETTDLLSQFAEEYAQDKELQDILGVHKDRALTEIYTSFANSSWDLVSAAPEQERITHLRSYIFYSCKDPAIAPSDRLQLVRQCMQRVKEQVSTEIVHSLIETLMQDTEMQELLGNDPQTWNLE